MFEFLKNIMNKEENPTTNDANSFHRILVMDKGEIVQEGKHKDLVKKKGLYKKLWERELATNIVKNKN